ncbi:MAG TPA: hypothetical protein VGB79_13595 [Allosphingosinicella sp.]|jgi:hypothetical protein
MKIHGDYHAQGYALASDLFPAEVAQALLERIETDLKASNFGFKDFAKKLDLMQKPTVEISGHLYAPLITFLWALTPTISQLVGRELLPSYNYFRIYSEGDICRLHSDRPSCEHSLSLTLGYSDAKPWPLDIGSIPMEAPDYLRESFGEEPFASIPMKPGDAVLYQGVRYRHGRLTPNPNRWSAHLFLHWVDRNGPYRAHAFDAERIAAEAERLGARPAHGS